jgi:signal transduction histidine kinase
MLLPDGLTWTWMCLLSLGLVCLGLLYLWRSAVSRQQALREQLTHAQAGKQRLQAFLTSMSHHLRTPLNGIMGYAEYIHSSSQEPMVQFTSKIILENSLHMLDLANGLLDLSHIQEGTLRLSQSSFEIHDLLDSLKVLHQARADEAGIQLFTQIALDTPATMHADPYRVRQVLNNLLDNALKYTPPQGQVVMAVSPTANGQCVTFSVQDSGPGIALELQHQLFKPDFADPSSFVLRPKEGAGLGLLLSHQLVGLMGGTLDFTTQVGQGSLFFFTLPLQADNPA